MDEELGNEPPLPLGLTLFLAEGAAKKQDDTSSSSTPLPMKSHGHLPAIDPRAALPIEEGPGLSSQTICW